MHVVGHEDIGVHLSAIASGGILKAIQIEAVIVVGEEARLPIVAALDDMQGLSGNDHPWQSGH